MQVKVEINAKQKFEDHEESEVNKCDGEITYHNKGAVLKFTEKYEDQALQFKMTILNNKIIIDRNNQTMMLEKGIRTPSIVNTPYGEMKMNVIAKQINIIKEKEEIRKINLGYEIELENDMKYHNEVSIEISKK